MTTVSVFLYSCQYLISKFLIFNLFILLYSYLFVKLFTRTGYYTHDLYMLGKNSALSQLPVVLYGLKTIFLLEFYF